MPKAKNKARRQGEEILKEDKENPEEEEGASEGADEDEDLIEGDGEDEDSGEWPRAPKAQDNDWEERDNY